MPIFACLERTVADSSAGPVTHRLHRRVSLIVGASLRWKNWLEAAEGQNYSEHQSQLSLAYPPLIKSFRADQELILQKIAVVEVATRPLRSQQPTYLLQIHSSLLLV